MKKLLYSLLFLSFFSIGEAKQNKFYISLAGGTTESKVEKFVDFQYTGNVGLGLFLSPKIRVEAAYHGRTKLKDSKKNSL